MNKGPRSFGFTDFLFNTLLFFFTIIILLLLLINPPSKTGDIQLAGDVVVVIAWPGPLVDDVDLYVLDPAGNVVWYVQKIAGHMHLDIDACVGTRACNEGPWNQEVVVIRGLIPGEYAVGVHMYSKQVPDPTPITWRVERINPRYQAVGEGIVVLDKPKQYAFITRFAYTEDQPLVANDNYLDIRRYLNNRFAP